MRKRYLFAFTAAVLVMAVFSACSGEKREQTPADVPPAAVSSGELSGSDVSASDAGDWYAGLDGTGRELAAVILRSTDAFNAKDKAGYMAAIDRESEAYAETKKYVNYIFKHYMLTASVDSIEVVEAGEDSASVRVTQTTVRSGDVEEGRTFADAQTVLLHTMTKRGGEWVISSTVVESRRELVSGWDALAAFEQAALSGSDAVSNSDNAE